MLYYAKIYNKMLCSQLVCSPSSAFSYTRSHIILQIVHCINMIEVVDMVKRVQNEHLLHIILV